MMRKKGDKMKTLQLLIVSPDETNVDALRHALDQDRFAVTSADSDEAAIEQFCQRAFDVVVTGKAMDDVAVKKLNAVVNRVDGRIVVIRQDDDHYAALEARIRDGYIAAQKEHLKHISINDTMDAINLEGSESLKV
jgi:DNA-binding NtrC family response regulator